MAGLQDVERALIDAAAVALGLTSYADGSQALSSVAGCKLRLFRGWPTAAQLDADLLTGAGQINVIPLRGNAQLTTRYQTQDYVAAVVPTLTAAVSGAVVTFGGAGGAGQVAGVRSSVGKTGVAYAYRLGEADTPATVAAGLAAIIPHATASGAVLTLPWPALARVVADQIVQTETRRTQQRFQLSLWMPNVTSRDAAADALDAALSAPFITTASGENIRLLYAGTNVLDATQKERFWRRDLMFQAEYATMQTASVPSMLFGWENISLINAHQAVGDLPHGEFTLSQTFTLNASFIE